MELRDFLVDLYGTPTEEFIETGGWYASWELIKAKEVTDKPVAKVYLPCGIKLRGMRQITRELPALLDKAVRWDRKRERRFEMFRDTVMNRWDFKEPCWNKGETGFFTKSKPPIVYEQKGRGWWGARGPLVTIPTNDGYIQIAWDGASEWRGTVRYSEGSIFLTRAAGYGGIQDVADAIGSYIPLNTVRWWRGILDALNPFS